MPGELLERERELERLAELLRAAAVGEGGAALVEGPAGIGKTSLLEALAARAEESGLQPLRARGGELERDLAYGLVRQLLGPRLARATAPERARLLDGPAALAAPLVGLADGAPGVVGDDPTASALHALYWLTANLAGEAPLLLVADDVHWGDQASIRFLVYLARRAAELPVLVLSASRPPVESHVPELLDALAADPAVLRVAPAPLTASAVATLTRSRLGDGAPAAACHAATGGNPFLVESVLRTLAEEGVAAADRVLQGGSPQIGRSVARRLAQLGPDAQALAQAVAVIGTDADARHAHALSGLAPDSAAAVEHALMAAGILARRRPLEFVHPIVRTAVAAHLTPPERATQHLAAARILAAEGAAAQRLAPHLLAADARADRWVVETLREAARQAVERGAPDAAVRYLRRALDEPPGPDVRPAVLAELGRAEVRAALPDDAVEHLRAALTATPDPRERARMTHDLALGLIAPGRYVEAVQMLQDALDVVRGTDDELTRRLEAELLCAARLDERTLPVAATVYARLPRRIAGDTPGGRMLQATVAHERVLRGDTAASVAALAGAAAEGGLVAEQSGDSGLVMDAGFALAVAGDFERAEQLFAAALDDARRRGSVIGFARTSTIRSIVRFHTGRLAAAESDARGAIAVAWEPGYRVAWMAHGPLVDALVEQGQLAAAEEALAAATLDGEIPDSFMLNFVLFARCRLRLAQGRSDDAAADLEELARRETKWRAGAPAVFPYRSLLALALGPGARARELADEEVALARAWGAPGPLGRALRVAGLVTGGAAGLALLQESLRTVDGSGWRLEHAHTLVHLGAALRRAGERSAAREPLHAGMELAHTCGAAPLAERAHDELVATGARPRRIMRTGREALTASERRVAEMAAGGRTNREIAQALFVTTRTVEVHLTHAYQKLGIASRAELPEALGPQAASAQASAGIA